MLYSSINGILSPSKAMKQLKDYLGLWSYTHASAEKFYSVTPQGELYRIAWGDDPLILGRTNKITVVDAKEAFRRIRSKARGGYALVVPYAGACHDSALLQVEDLYSAKSVQKSKPQAPPKKKFSFLDWISER